MEKTISVTLLVPEDEFAREAACALMQWQLEALEAAGCSRFDVMYDPEIIDDYMIVEHWDSPNDMAAFRSGKSGDDFYAGICPVYSFLDSRIMKSFI